VHALAKKVLHASAQTRLDQTSEPPLPLLHIVATPRTLSLTLKQPYLDEGSRIQLYQLSHLTDKLTAALLALPKTTKRTLVVRESLLCFIRRFLITLGSTKLRLIMRGVLPNFARYWRILNTPTKHIFAHPLTSWPVTDVSLEAAAKLRSGAP